MEITTIICGYNQGRFAAKAIASALDQVPAPAAVVFVDNGSQDDTATVVQAFGAAVRYVCQENLGPAAARNRGLREAQTEFVHFLDADDWIEPGMYAAASLVAGADVIVGGQTAVSPDGAIISRTEAPVGLERPAEYLLRHHPWAVHAAIVRYSRAADVKGFDESLWQAEDWDFWLRLAGSGATFASFAGNQAVYRRLPGSNSGDFRKVGRSARRVLAAALARQGTDAHRRRLVRACLAESDYWIWIEKIRPQLSAHLDRRELAAALRLAFAAIGASRDHLPRVVRHVATHAFRALKRLLVRS